MADKKAQLEDGYTRIANELIEAMCALRITTTEHIVLLSIMRKTYGFGKKNDRIALSQISLLTGLQKPHISRAIKMLVMRNIITPSGNFLGMNTDIGAWKKELPRQVTNHESLPRGVTRVTPSGNTALPHGAPQKKLLQKILSQKIPNGSAQGARLSAEEKKKRAEIMRAENDLMLAFLKSKIQLDDFTELQSEQRKWARNLVALFKKCGKQVCKDRLDSILSVPYKAQNCNSLIYIYKQIKGFKEPQNAIKTNFIS